MKKDMGGMRKFMPKTYVTFVIGSLALAGMFPLAGFWSKDEILVNTGGWDLLGGSGAAPGSYTFHFVMGMVGAALTAAYMTRCVYLTFHGEFRGGHHDDHAHDADPAHADDHADDHAHHGDPHESGPRILYPLYILSAFSILVGFVNFPPGFLTGSKKDPSGWQERFLHFIEPAGSSYFPAVGHATPSWSLAIVASLVAVLGAGFAFYYYFVRLDRLSKQQGVSLTGIPNGLTTTNAFARTGHKILVNKYYFDHLYTGIIAGFTKGPLARATNWVNQNVIDGMVDRAGQSAVSTGQMVYEKIDQGVVDGFVNGSGRVSDITGEELRHINSGRVQNYAAIMFAGAAILAGAFVILLAL